MHIYCMFDSITLCLKPHYEETNFILRREDDEDKQALLSSLELA